VILVLDILHLKKNTSNLKLNIVLYLCLLQIVGSFGKKALVGNRFVWGEVVRNDAHPFRLMHKAHETLLLPYEKLRVCIL
jgi:hypothetical protein